MNAKSCCLLFAAGLLTAAVPGYAAPAQSSGSMSQSQYSAQQPVRGEHEAHKMVEADAVFTKTVDSNSVQPGAQITAKLTHAVTLDNGTKLPKGTVLNGQIVQDTSQPDHTRVAVQFTQAELANQAIPIKATIVGIYATPTYEGVASRAANPNNAVPPSWNDGTLKIDQINALPGIDLHSSIAGQDSGVFVSNKKSNVKIGPTDSVALAIAPAANSNSAMNAGSQNYNQTNTAHNNLRQPDYPQR